MSPKDGSETRAWLEQFEQLVGSKESDVHKLVQDCFKVRGMTPFRVLNQLAIASQESAPAFGRLGEHLNAARTLVSASLTMPYLLDDFNVKVRRSSHSIPPPLSPARTDLEGIIGRAFQSVDDIERYRDVLSSMDRILDGGLRKGVKDRCSVSTRVHGELLLVDLFQERGFDFVAGDKYIGCSKPACYCCYHYILALRGDFSLSSQPSLSMPACHNKLYLSWRAPDVAESRGEVAVKRRQDALNTMLKYIRADLQSQIDSRAPRRPSQFDSLTGGTSLRERDLPSIRDYEQSSPAQVERGYHLKR